MTAFNEDYYKFLYGDRLEETAFPIVHYILKGWREGLNPAPDFNTAWYVAAWPDAASANISPLDHYEKTGRISGFTPFPDLAGDISPNIRKHLEDSAYYIGWKAGLFDAEYYSATNPDLFEGMGALNHYRNYGWRENRNPCSWADLPGLLLDIGDLDGDRPPFLALTDAIGSGATIALANGTLGEEAISLGLFDPEFYMLQLPQENTCKEPFSHFALIGWRLGLNPSSALNTRFFIENYMEEPGNPVLAILSDPERYITETLIPPLKWAEDIPEYLIRHVEAIIAHEVRKRDWFDEDYYMQTYPDIAQGGASAWEHYRRFGYRENRSPSSKFDSKWYLERYLCNDASSCAIFHYLFEGESLGNLPAPIQEIEMLREENKILYEQIRKMQRQLDQVGNISVVEKKLKSVSQNYKKTLDFLIEQLGIISASQPK